MDTRLYAVTLQRGPGGSLHWRLEPDRQQLLEPVLRKLAEIYKESGLKEAVRWLVVLHAMTGDEGLLAVARFDDGEPRAVAGKVSRQAELWPLGFALRQIEDVPRPEVVVPPVVEQVRIDAERLAPITDLPGDAALLFLNLWQGHSVHLRVTDVRGALALAILTARTGQTLRLAAGPGKPPDGLAGAWLFVELIEPGTKAEALGSRNIEGAVRQTMAELLGAGQYSKALRFAGLCSKTADIKKLRDFDSYVVDIHHQAEEDMDATLGGNLQSLSSRFHELYRRQALEPEESERDQPAPATPALREKWERKENVRQFPGPKPVAVPPSPISSMPHAEGGAAVSARAAVPEEAVTPEPAPEPEPEVQEETAPEKELEVEEKVVEEPSKEKPSETARPPGDDGPQAAADEGAEPEAETPEASKAGSASPSSAWAPFVIRPQPLPAAGGLAAWIRQRAPRTVRRWDVLRKWLAGRDEADWSDFSLFCPFCGEEYRFSEITHGAIDDRDGRVAAALSQNPQWQKELGIVVKHLSPDTKDLLRDLRELFAWRPSGDFEKSLRGHDDFAQNLWDMVQRAAGEAQIGHGGGIADMRLQLKVAFDETEVPLRHPSQKLVVVENDGDVVHGRQPVLCCPHCLEEIPLCDRLALRPGKRFLHASARTGYVALLGVARCGKTVLLSTLLSDFAKPPDSARDLTFVRDARPSPEIGKAIRLLSKCLRAITSTKLRNWVWTPAFLELKYPIHARRNGSVSLALSDIPGEEFGPSIKEVRPAERSSMRPMIKSLKHAAVIIFIVDLQASDEYLEAAHETFHEVRHALTRAGRKIPLILLLTKTDGYCLTGPWPSPNDARHARRLAQRLQSRILRMGENPRDLKSFLEEESRWLADWMRQVERLKGRSFTEALDSAGSIFGTPRVCAVSSIGTAPYHSAVLLGGGRQYQEYSHSPRPVLLDMPFVLALLAMEVPEVDLDRLEPSWFRNTR